LTAWIDEYVWLAGVVSDGCQVGPQFVNASIDMPFGVVAGAQCKKEKSFVVFLTEPDSVFGTDPLPLLSPDTQIF